MTPALPFLTDEALAHLTGYRQKSKQIQQLRAMGVPFRVNAAGRPVVATAAIEGASAVRKPVEGREMPAWQPDVLKRA